MSSLFVSVLVGRVVVRLGEGPLGLGRRALDGAWKLFLNRLAVLIGLGHDSSLGFQVSLRCRLGLTPAVARKHVAEPGQDAGAGGQREPAEDAAAWAEDEAAAKAVYTCRVAVHGGREIGDAWSRIPAPVPREAGVRWQYPSNHYRVGPVPGANQ
jgi:hypothetical protein